MLVDQEILAQRMLDRQIEAQQALDELLKEQLLPFKLSAAKVVHIGLDEYVVRFYDSRLHSVDITCNEGESFKHVVREAVLGRVKRLGGPLRTRLPHDQTQNQ
jgi:hypothetical protein